MTKRKRTNLNSSFIALVHKKFKFIVIVFFILSCSIIVFKTAVFAEQSSGSPDNGVGVISYIKQLYSDLSTLTYGTDNDTPDWGTYWNRIKTAAKWTPDGNAAASDIRSGKTFYSNSRTQQTGTAQLAGPCPNQQYYDNNASATQENNCNITWIAAGDGVSGSDKKDPRTGLVWSNMLYNNSGTVEFSSSSVSPWSWDGSGANNVAAGGKTASQLCSERGNGWYLPSQKEMMQAYIDGANFNLTNVNYSLCAKTEQDSTIAFVMSLSAGSMAGTVKSSSVRYVRCVR
jgi:hypothetical protein